MAGFPFTPGRLFAAFALSFSWLFSAAAVEQNTPVKIVLVGDSTVTDGSGWGAGFRQFVNEGATVDNTAQGGRSSKSFRAEGHWDRALALKGDYYLIQFGHNDQPGKGPDRETEPATTFTENMARYVDEVRALGAKPVLVTSLVRRNFSKDDPSRIESTLTPYVEAVKKLAAAKQVPLIDLHALSLAWCERIGPAETAKLNPRKPDGTPDTTHLAGEGSVVFARLVADELRQIVPGLAPVLRAEPIGPSAPRIAVAAPFAPGLHPDIEYGQAAGVSLKLDVHVPDGDGLFPIAILVHGGGWSSGDKSGSDKPGNGADITPWFAPLSEAQFTWFSINYRTAPAHRWPACLEDVQTAIRWVKQHAAEFKGDASRIALIGHSAGGHLVSLAACIAADDTQVQAVVGFAPVTDFEFELSLRGGLSVSLQQLHDQPKEVTPETLRILRETSPITQVRAGLPPFLILHGEKDKTVPLVESENFQQKLRAAGNRCDLIIIPGGSHGLLDWAKLSPDYSARMVAWLKEQLIFPPSKG